MNETYKGFSLFNDVEDAELRNRNRAVVLANIATDHTRKKLLSGKGAALVLGYFGAIPPEERGDVQRRFKQNMEDRGYVFTAS